MKDYSFIATDRPANRTAGMVLQKGEHFEEPNYTNLFKAPLLLIKYKGKRNLSGKRFFQFTVIGYLGMNNRSGRWLLKCDCGSYTVRSERAIKKIVEKNGKCSRCSYLDYIKSETYRERYLRKIKLEQIRRDSQNKT